MTLGAMRWHWHVVVEVMWHGLWVCNTAVLQCCRSEALTRLRRAENRRALLEGARFVLHGRDGSQRQVFMWLAETGDRCLNIAALPDAQDALKTLKRAQSSKGPRSAEVEGVWGITAKSQLHLVRSIPLSSLITIVSGTSHFPGQSSDGAAGWSQLKAMLLGSGGTTAAKDSNPATAGLRDDRCLTVVCSSAAAAHGHEQGHRSRSSALAGLSGRTNVGYNLRLPLNGNGRSRDEWVAGLTDVIAAHSNRTTSATSLHQDLPDSRHAAPVDSGPVSGQVSSANSRKSISSVGNRANQQDSPGMTNGTHDIKGAGSSAGHSDEDTRH